MTPQRRRSTWRAEGRSLDDKGWVPLRYWLLWWSGFGAAIVLFYVILTPIWLGLRAAAWAAEMRARRRARDPVTRLSDPA